MGDLYLIDGTGIAYRAFFALEGFFQNQEGIPTNATFGVVRMIKKILDDFIRLDDDSIVFVMDKKTKTYRHKLLESYKAQRPKAPDEFIIQIPYITEVVENMGIPVLTLDAHEADDIIATLAVKGKNKFDNIYIITSDKDMMQLVKENIYILRPEKGITDIKMYNRDKVYEKMGVYPENIVDLLALMGDKADNIPGVKGIGVKTAQKLVDEFGTIEKIYEGIENIKGSVKTKLESDKDMAFLSKKLIELTLDAPIDFDENNYTYKGFKNELTENLKNLNFKSIIREFNLSDETPEEANNKTDYSKKVEYKNIEINDIERFLAEHGNDIFISFDLETDSVDPVKAKILGIAISFKPFEGFYINIGKLSENEKKPIIYKVTDFLKDKKIIGQNIKYDIIVLSNYGINTENIYFDTMIAAYLTEPDERKFNMDDLAEKYLNYNTVKYKELFQNKLFATSLNDIDTKEVTNYAGEDADITYRLYDVLKEKLKQENTENLFSNIEIPFIYVLKDMEKNGVFFDIPYLKSLETEYTNLSKSIQEKIFTYSGTNFNPNSPKQISELLFNKLGLKGNKKTKNGSYSTDAESLEYLRSEHPVVDLILENRKYQKLLSTYITAIPKLVNPITKRVHSTFSQTVAATGRLSSSDPNLQNLPIKDSEGEKIRKAVKAQDNGNILLSADYSQIELRILAHLSQDPVLTEAYRNEKDIHSLTASKIFGVPIEDVDTEMRRVGKTINFSIIYGISAYGLSGRIDISMKKSKEFIDKYFELYSGVKLYQENILKESKKTGYVETIFGRKRYLNKIRGNKGDIERIAINSPIQGTAADIMKIAMINMRKKLPDYAKIILQVHDEVLIELPESKAEEISEIVKNEMENAVVLNIPLKADIHYGKNWEK